ncbi:MAG: FecR domain-containing protein [Tannerella sp.]|jgi:ferric-dicitrate binding protein FerR (iron transport regulator)|nr:FecR domain-containing protein [Tannerella sp.]
MSKIYKIIELFFKQTHPEDVQKKFFFWLKAPYASRAKEEAINQVWNDLHIEADQSTKKSYEQVEERLEFVARKKSRSISSVIFSQRHNQSKHRFCPPAYRKHSLYIRFARIAAIFIIPLLSVLSAWWFVQNQQAPELTLVEYFVPNGETREIVLPDNSKVIINSGSTLFYPAELKGKNREIYLSGEAKFMVAQDKKKPFIVKTNDMNVEALGTVFNISSYSDNSHTTATLAKGKIKVDIKSTNESFILDPHEQVLFDKKTGQSLQQQVRLDYVLAWEKGQMVFQRASLYEIVKEIERRYDVTIYLNSKAWDNEIITVKFLYDETLDDILTVLKHIIKGFNYEIKGDKIYIH